MNTKKLKQLVLDLAIHGKLVPQDPNDEPASVLLERIVETHGRASKNTKGKKSSISSEEIDEVPFEVPEGWCWTRLGSIAQLINGDRSNNYPNKNEYVPQGIPWINTGHITINGFLSAENMNFITVEKFNSLGSGKIQKDDLVFCLRGATFGKIARVEPYTEGAIASSLVIIRSYFASIRDYIFHVLKSDYAKLQLSLYDNGSAQPNLAAKDVEKYLIPLPPLAEQHRIVAAIEKWFAVIDQLEKNEADLKKSIEQTKKKVLDLAIRGKLVAQNPEDEPAGELLARIRADVETHGRASNKAKGKKSAIPSVDLDEVPFEVPSSWCWTTIGSISSNILYGVNESAKEFGRYKLLRITDIQENKVDWNTVPFTDFDETKVCDYLLRKNDILFARTGATVGKSYLVEEDVVNCIYASYLIKVQANTLLNPKYVKRYFESAYYWNQISDNSIGTGQPNVNGTILASLTIPLPPLAEQKRIVEKIEEVMGVLERIEEMMG